MTPAEVRARVEAIRGRAGDPEWAHGDEDDIHADVLRAIAEGADNPAELAAEALRTSEIEFPRWYA